MKARGSRFVIELRNGTPDFDVATSRPLTIAGNTDVSKTHYCIRTAMSESLTDSSEEDTGPVHRSKRKRDVDDEASRDGAPSDAAEQGAASVEDSDANDSPTVHNGIVEFELSSVVERFTCTLCSGLFKDPLTITECLHSFCRSCLFSYFANTGKKHCPRCNMLLEPDPYKNAMRDRTLESLCEKVLFVDAKERDDVEEKKFYAKRGILPKPEFESDMSPERAAPITTTDDELEFLLVPDEKADKQHRLPPLKQPHIKVSGRFKILGVKKYLLQQLKMDLKLLSSVEIKCRNEIVGNEHSLHFIECTKWMMSDRMTLEYCFSEDLLV